MAPRIRAQTLGGGLGITPTSVAFYDVLSAGGTIAQMAVGGGLTGTWALINSSSSLVALSAGGLMTRGAGAATSGTPVVQFTSGSTILQVPITATVIVATLPANTVLPSLSPSGTPVVGVTLTATSGTWTGDPTPTYAYQWRQVDTSTNISGATSATYTPVSGDVGHTLTCVVTATNIKGSASASAATTPAVISVPVAPVNTVAPGAPTGSANVGATLTAQNGTWTGNPSPTFTYAWFVNGVANGATGSTYVPVSGDLGSVISVRVTGTNVAGSASATSAATAAITIAPSIPSNTVAPGVPTGTPSVGNVLTAQNGTWAGYPAPTFTYQWQRNGTNISGATASTYTLVSADAGNPIRVVVTGTNASGSASANSTATTNVTMAPANTVAPTLSSNTPNVGTAITCSPGTWTGYAAPTFTYQWFWADTVAPISGATSASYTPVSGDIGHTLSCNVTGANSVGSASASTSATGAVTNAPSMPTGALGIWNVADYSSATKAIPNSAVTSAVSTNILRGSRNAFSFGGLYTPNRCTVADGQPSAPDGSSEATLVTITGGSFFIQAGHAGTLPAGTYTLAINAKQGAAGQTFRLTGNGGGAYSSVFTTSGSWQRFTHTFTVGTTQALAGIWIAWDGGAGTTGSFYVCDLNLYAGSSDLGAQSGNDGNLYLGTSQYDTSTSVASGELNLSSSGMGLITFPASTTYTTITTQALLKKVGAGGAFQGFLSHFSNYQTFSAFLDSSSVPKTMFNDDYSKVVIGPGTQGAQLFDILNKGYHLITHRYNGTQEELWVDDVRMFVNVTTASSFAMQRMFMNCIAGLTNYGPYKYIGLAHWNRSLSNSELLQSFSYWKSAGTTAGLTVNGDTTDRMYFPEGDSITALATSFPYIYAGNASPAVIGSNFAVTGSTLADCVNRAAALDACLPTSMNGRKFITSILIGANDLNGYPGASDAAAAASYTTALAAWCDARRAAGWKVVVCTILPRSGFTAHNARRAIVNANITGSWLGVHCDAIADFAADPTMGPDNSFTVNPGDWTDVTHPNASGFAILEPIIRTQINAL